MFTGAIRAAVRPHIARLAEEWEPGPVWVGSSGNFTLERLLQTTFPGKFTFHSNDVSLYSCALGLACMGQLPPGLHVREDVTDRWGWLEDWIRDPYDAVATLMLCTSMLEGCRKTGPAAAYYARIADAYRADWEDLHARTRQRVAENLDPLQDRVELFAGDIREHQARRPAGEPFMAFPPTYTGGYEALYKDMDHVWAWDEPAYPAFDDAAWDALVEDVTGNAPWMLGRDVEQPQLDGYLRGSFQDSESVHPIYLWADQGDLGLIMPRTLLEPLPWPRVGESPLPPHATLALVEVKPAQFRLLKHQYVRLKTRAAGPTLNASRWQRVVLVNGRVAGGVAVDPVNAVISRAGVRAADVYVMADFAVFPGPPKLAKLVLAALLVGSVRAELAATFARPVEAAITTAFTDRPVSMKYRGLFDLVSRAQKPEPHLNYWARLGRFATYDEAYQWWWERHQKAAWEEHRDG